MYNLVLWNRFLIKKFVVPGAMFGNHLLNAIYFTNSFRMTQSNLDILVLRKAKFSLVFVPRFKTSWSIRPNPEDRINDQMTE